MMPEAWKLALLSSEMLLRHLLWVGHWRNTCLRLEVGALRVRPIWSQFCRVLRQVIHLVPVWMLALT